MLGLNPGGPLGGINLANAPTAHRKSSLLPKIKEKYKFCGFFRFLAKVTWCVTFFLPVSEE